MALSGFEDEERAIQDRFHANYSASPVQYDNAPIDDDLIRGIGWVRFNIFTAASSQVSIGDSPVDRHPGIIIIQSFTPENEGTRMEKQRFDLIDSIFKRKEFRFGDSGLIRTRVPTISRVGNENGWHQSNIEIPYIRDVQ